jgi:hypothetical protein
MEGVRAMAVAMLIRLRPGRPVADIRFQGKATRRERVEALRLAAFLSPLVAELEAAMRLWAALQNQSGEVREDDDS